MKYETPVIYIYKSGSFYEPLTRACQELMRSYGLCCVGATKGFVSSAIKSMKVRHFDIRVIEDLEVVTMVKGLEDIVRATIKLSTLSDHSPIAGLAEIQSNLMQSIEKAKENAITLQEKWEQADAA